MPYVLVMPYMRNMHFVSNDRLRCLVGSRVGVGYLDLANCVRMIVMDRPVVYKPTGFGVSSVWAKIELDADATSLLARHSP